MNIICSDKRVYLQDQNPWQPAGNGVGDCTLEIQANRRQTVRRNPLQRYSTYVPAEASRWQSLDGNNHPRDSKWDRNGFDKVLKD